MRRTASPPSASAAAPPQKTGERGQQQSQREHGPGEFHVRFQATAIARPARMGATHVAAPKSASPVIGIYPGTFDPLTSGHLDLIERGSHLVDRLIVAVLANEAKHPLFSMEERTEMLREATVRFPNVEVDSFDGLLVQFASARGAKLLLRGIRAVSDYEYELQMALMNRRLNPNIETVFLMAGESYSFLSSRMVKEVIRLGGDVSQMVPPNVEQRLRARLLGATAVPE